MGKPIIWIGENKGANQLCSNFTADQRLCFRYTDSTIPLLSKSKISSLKPSSVVCVGPGQSHNCWFSCTGSYFIVRQIMYKTADKRMKSCDRMNNPRYKLFILKVRHKKYICNMFASIYHLFVDFCIPKIILIQQKI